MKLFLPTQLTMYTSIIKFERVASPQKVHMICVISRRFNPLHVYRQLLFHNKFCLLLTIYPLNSAFRWFSRYNLRYAPVVYRFIDSALLREIFPWSLLILKSKFWQRASISLKHYLKDCIQSDYELILYSIVCGRINTMFIRLNSSMESFYWLLQCLWPNSIVR